MKRRRHKRIKVVFRKLGREGALGQAIAAERLVELDPRLRSRAMLSTAIHEVLHIVATEWSESRVEKASQKIAGVLWFLGFRRVGK